MKTSTKRMSYLENFWLATTYQKAILSTHHLFYSKKSNPFHILYSV